MLKKIFFWRFVELSQKLISLDATSLSQDCHLPKSCFLLTRKQFYTSMKTSSILVAAAFLLMPWCLSPLFSQNQSAGQEKKITIIKHSIDADGSEVTETIVKKGKAAENFDVEKYVRDNRGDKNQIEVIVNEGNEVEDESEEYSWDNNTQCKNMSWTRNVDNNAFLGVEEDSDEDANQPGLVVEVIRGSAADKAGLRDNDKILSINATKTNRWSDLSQFVNQSKPGDKVKIIYSRNGKTAETEATLSTRKDVSNNKPAPHGFLGVNDEGDDDDAEGVEISIINNSAVAKAGLKDGDVIYQLNDTPVADFEDISDFMAYTKPGEKVLVNYGRDGNRKSVEVLLGSQQSSWNGENFDITIPRINLKGLEDFDIDIEYPSKISCTVKEKEACLGVYSDEDESGRGTAIQSFTTESAAREAGIQEGDVILSVNGQEINGHSELWDEIAKYKTGDNVKVAYEREGKSMQVQATLKACRDNQSRVEIQNRSENGGRENRQFYTREWNSDDQRHLRETRIIIIRKAGEGDGAKVNINPNANKPAQDRSLSLTSFRAFPNPSQGQVTVEFKGEPVATVVSLLDISGRQLFREELNAFNGEYNQQFDLTAYAKGTIIIHVQQGEQVFTEQLIVN